MNIARQCNASQDGGEVTGPKGKTILHNYDKNRKRWDRQDLRYKNSLLQFIARGTGGGPCRATGGTPSSPAAPRDEREERETYHSAETRTNVFTQAENIPTQEKKKAHKNKGRGKKRGLTVGMGNFEFEAPGENRP